MGSTPTDGSRIMRRCKHASMKSTVSCKHVVTNLQSCNGLLQVYFELGRQSADSAYRHGCVCSRSKIPKPGMRSVGCVTDVANISAGRRMPVVSLGGGGSSNNKGRRKGPERFPATAIGQPPLCESGTDARAPVLFCPQGGPQDGYLV